MTISIQTRDLPARGEPRVDPDPDGQMPAVKLLRKSYGPVTGGISAALAA